MNYSINKEETVTIEVDKSKFIGIIKNFKNLAEFNDFLENLHKNHPKARHICYAYNINGEIKMCDNGEPSGTAGKPIYNVIYFNNLKNVAIFVIRYFGGQLLGSGKLLRTYSEVSKKLIENIKLIPLIKEKLLKVSVDYNVYNTFKYFLVSLHFDILNEAFNDKIFIEFYVPIDFDFKSIKERFIDTVSLVESYEVERLKE